MTTHIDHTADPQNTPTTSEQTVDIRRLVAEFVAVSPKLDETEARIAVGLHRLLAEGSPFVSAALSARLRLPERAVTAAIEGILAPGVIKDEEGRIVGFWGLGLPSLPSPHQLEVDGRTLYAWCAPDTLFLPRLLGKTARVRSTMKRTDQQIELVVGPDGIERASLSDAAATFVRPLGKGLESATQILSAFCHHMWFFPSEAAARDWARGREDVVVLPIQQGFYATRRFVDEVFGLGL